jgi:hypothetical protein
VNLPRRRPLRRAGHALALAHLAVACASPFSAINLVDRPRVLLVQTNPVAVMAGQTLAARAVFAGTRAARVRRWRVCVPVRIDPFPEQRCADGQGVVAHTQDGGDALSWQLPTDESTLGTWVFAASVDATGATPRPDQILASLRSNGLDLLVYVEAEADEGEVLRGVKRALFTIAPLRLSPLSVPRFSFGGQGPDRRLAPRGEQCVPSDGEELLVDPGSTASVLLEETGAAFGEQVSHYADGGDFTARFESPDVGPWIAPTRSGTLVRHWLVVQRSVSRGQGARVSDVRFCEWRVRVR